LARLDPSCDFDAAYGLIMPQYLHQVLAAFWLETCRGKGTLPFHNELPPVACWSQILNIGAEVLEGVIIDPTDVYTLIILLEVALLVCLHETSTELFNL
jgi:hypothetical protein